MHEFNIQLQKNQPCRCLCRFSLQIILTVFFRLITLQLRHIFLTDAPTFILKSSRYRQIIFFSLSKNLNLTGFYLYP